MPAASSNIADTLAEARRLQGRIARVRRRLDRRAGSMIDHSLLLGSWRGFVEKYPGRSLAAAAGVGLAASLLLPSGAELGQLGGRIYDTLTGGMWQEVWGSLREILERMPTAPAGGAGAAEESPNA